MKKLLFLIALLLVVIISRLQAATCNASTWAEFSTCVSTTAAGDTIQLATATFHANSSIVINKRLTIQGNGINNTIIQDELSNSQADSGVKIIDWTIGSGGLSRFTGIQLADGGTHACPTHCNQLPFVWINGENDGRLFRLDNSKFYRIQGGSTIWFDTVIGVVDHNTFDWNVLLAMGYVLDNRWNGQQNGDGSVAAGNLLGTSNALYIEDNNFVCEVPGTPCHIMDGQSGARYVGRYNTGCGLFETHGTESGNRNRGGVEFEIYRNIFVASATCDGNGTGYWRSGLVYQHDNTYYNYSSLSLPLLVNRCCDSFTPWGIADGTNLWDANGADPGVSGSATSVGSLTITDNTKSWTTNQWTGYSVLRTGQGTGTGVFTATLNRSGTTVTVDTSPAHGLSNGDPVGFRNCTDKLYKNALFGVTVNTTTQFTFTEFYTTATSDSCIGMKGNTASEIASNTPTTLTFKDSVYSGAYSLAFTTGNNYAIRQVTNAIDMVGRISGSLISNDPPTLPGGWNDQTTLRARTWNNCQDTQNPPRIGCGGGGTPVTFSADPMIILNTNYSNDSSAPGGYTEFTYPHPIITCGQLSCGGGAGPVRFKMRKH